MSLPGRGEALGILRGSGCSDGVVCHCVSVAGIAVRLAGVLVGRGVVVDVALVEAGVQIGWPTRLVSVGPDLPAAGYILDGVSEDG